MESNTLKILAVSDDRAALRHLIKFLTAFGYQVLSATDVAQAIAATQAHHIDFLIIDDRLKTECEEVCRSLAQSRSDHPRFTFLLTKDPESRQVSTALAAGVDDFLTRPLVYGELLARLRAGARALENRRRFGQQAATDEVTNLPSKSAFRRKLQQYVTEMRKTSKPVACVLLDIDFFERITRAHGHSASCQLLNRLAEHLEQLIRPTDELACFGHDQFAVLLPACDEQDAVAEAERLRASIADTQIACDDIEIALTASAGVACWDRDANEADEIIRLAEKALELAKKSGRNCVIRNGELGDETKAWHELAAPGRLFESTRARDVMTPCPVTLRSDDPFHKATTLFQQSELLAIPVVDRTGHFAGVVWRESFINGSDVHETYPASHLNGQLGEQMDDTVECVEEDATFTELVERLSGDSTALLVVASAKRPTGLVTAPTLASLSQPLSADSFHSTKPYDDTTQYLAVAEEVQA